MLVVIDIISHGSYEYNYENCQQKSDLFNSSYNIFKNAH